MRYSLVYILFVIFMVISCWSCQKDMSDIPNPHTDRNNIITFTLNIPIDKNPSSRSIENITENQIVNMSVLVFEEQLIVQTAVIGERPEDFQDLNAGKSQNFTLTLDENLRESSSLQFYFIANYSPEEYNSILDITNLSELISLNIERKPQGIVDNPIPLCAKATLAELSTAPVSLVRSMAKITVSNIEDSQAGNTDYSFALYNSNSKGKLFAGISDKYTTTTSSAEDDLSLNTSKYVFPTRSSNHPFIIAKVPYNGNTENYYKIELRDDGHYIDIRPNFHYQVLIREVLAPGTNTLEEALNGSPSSAVDACVIENTPEILSIVSDGSRSLGTPRTLSFSVTDQQPILKISFYSNSDADLKTTPAIIRDDSWVHVGEPTILHATSNKPTKGKIASFPITFDDTEYHGLHSTRIHISWFGLERDVDLFWNPNFDMNSICKTALTITRPGNENITISDFNTFISGKGKETNQDGKAPVLYGIQPEMMGGNVRTQGFHFPVMYGEKGSEWSYSYDIQMSGLKDLDDTQWQVYTDPNGDNVITDYVIIQNATGTHIKGNDDIKFNISRPANSQAARGGTDYEYGTGRLIFEFKAGGAVKHYSFDLYHTGFFHYNSSATDYQTESPHKSETGYYYYEVLPIQTDSGVIHILDRNLGAKASGQYIDNPLCENIFNFQKEWPYSCGMLSAGTNYCLLNQANKGGLYFSELLPPGYSIPSGKAWRRIVAAGRYGFESFYIGAYIYNSIFYESIVSEMGRDKSVYTFFPKIHYYMGNDVKGNTDYGYYWTSDPSGGISDPSQNGKWFDYIVIKKNSPEFSPGQIENHYLSIRCVSSQ